MVHSWHEQRDQLPRVERALFSSAVMALCLPGDSEVNSDDQSSNIAEIKWKYQCAQFFRWAHFWKNTSVRWAKRRARAILLVFKDGKTCKQFEQWTVASDTEIKFAHTVAKIVFD